MRTIGTICTGIGGVEEGAILAGWKPLWGIEPNYMIADIAHLNYSTKVHIGTVESYRSSSFPPVDLIHCSPPCTNFSAAGRKKETSRDISIAAATSDFIRSMKPDFFTLENVPEYVNSMSWSVIRGALGSAGYLSRADTMDFSYMGVPQTRRRLIVRASRRDLIEEIPQGERTTWYPFLRDMIYDLPESELNIEGDDAESPSIVNTTYNRFRWRGVDKPCFTVLAWHARKSLLVKRGEGDFAYCHTRALARLQTFDDETFLPEDIRVGKAVGRAVPPQAYRRILMSLD